MAEEAAAAAAELFKPTLSTKKPPTKLPLLTKSTNSLPFTLPTPSCNQYLANQPITDQRISKRPLLHAPISSPRTSSTTPKVIYVSASSPFISVVKRVRTYLDAIESRSAGKLSLDGGEGRFLKGIEKGVNDTGKGKGGVERNGRKRNEEVVLKGTGRAIEKIVRLAAWWGEQSDVRVVVRTGSVGAVDDIVGNGDEGEADVEESRVRRVSCLEVGIRLR